MADETDQIVTRKHAGYAIMAGAALALLWLVWFVRPLYHGMMYFFVRNPQLIQYALLGGGLGVTGIVLSETGRSRAGGICYALGGTVIVLMVLIVPIATGLAGLGIGPANIYSQEDVADRMEDRIVVNDNLTSIDPDHPRVQTKHTSNTIADNSFTESRWKLGSGRTVVHNDTLYWGYSVIPDGFGNYLSKPVDGVYMISMESYSKQSSMIDGTVTNGPHTFFVGDHNWKLNKHHYWATYKDATVVPHDGDTVLYSPKVTHEWRIGNPLNGRLPVLYSVPKFSGVSVIDDGSVTHLTPEEAATHEVTHDQPYYPYDLARYEINSLNYRHGSMNKWFLGSKTDMIELASVPGMDNRQPFTVPTQSGLKYVTAVEPYGSGTGVKTIFQMDAQYVPGDDIVAYEQTDGMTGPAKAPNHVRNADSNRNWQNYDITEPIPTPINGTMYWMTHVVQDNGAGVDGIYFVEAQTNQVTKFEQVSSKQDVQLVKDFLAGDRTGEVAQPGEAPSQNSSGSVIVTVYEDGQQVDTFVLNGSGTIEVQAVNNSTA